MTNISGYDDNHVLGSLNKMRNETQQARGTFCTSEYRLITHNCIDLDMLPGLSLNNDMNPILELQNLIQCSMKNRLKKNS